MKICLFGIPGIALGKHNVKDPRLDQAHKLVEAQKKTYAQVDVVEEKEMLTADAILTTRAALSDLLMKDLDAVETRLGRDAGDAEKAVLQKMADGLISEKPVSAIGLTAEEFRQSWLLKAWDRDEASKFALLSTDLSAVVNKLFSRTLWHPTARMRLIQFLFYRYGVDEVAAAIKEKKDALEV